MKSETLVVIGIMAVGLLSYTASKMTGGTSSPVSVTTATKTVSPQDEQRRLAVQQELEALKHKTFWTGSLAKSEKGYKRIPLSIYKVDDGAPNNPPGILHEHQLIAREGTEFKVIGWSERFGYLRLRFADGQEGLIGTGYDVKTLAGSPLAPDEFYDHRKGIDRDLLQKIYEIPLKDARALQAKAQPQIDKERALAAKVERDRAAAVAREAKKQGATIGMNASQVVASAWGKPRKVNRTTTSRGVHEQWVYDGGYLYFEDGVLITIQN